MDSSKTQDWSKMRTKWQQIRDLKHVPKGAGGTSVKIGDALNLVGVAQAKGLKPFADELDRFEAKLKTYRAAIGKKAEKAKPKGPKDPDYKGFAAWIDANIQVWVTKDKSRAAKEVVMLKGALEAVNSQTTKIEGNPEQALQDAALDAAQAQNKKDADGMPDYESLPLVRADAARINEVFKKQVAGLDAVIKICTTVKTAYRSLDVTQPMVAAVSNLEKAATSFQAELAAILKEPDWDAVMFSGKSVARTAGNWQMSDVLDFGSAVRKRIG